MPVAKINPVTFRKLPPDAFSRVRDKAFLLVHPLLPGDDPKLKYAVATQLASIFDLSIGGMPVEAISTLQEHVGDLCEILKQCPSFLHQVSASEQAKFHDRMEELIQDKKGELKEAAMLPDSFWKLYNHP